ncbi:G protein-regulated inducer of neurite outgrowth 3 [Ambystoma mexicanum]|uniref:G protein-regulated inducer of neurite outgrowth 3 n=1 Tax=Ambystoma mexicanum TaxID=8296 RepID=UPI0037E7E433
MGTVSDSQGSAKDTIVGGTEEKVSLINPESTNHEHKQTITEKNGNGVPMPRAEAAGLGSFDLNCSTSIETPNSEQPCELGKQGLNQTVPPSPTSPAARELPSDAQALTNHKLPNHCVVEEHEPAGERNLVHVTDIQSNVHSAKPTMQIDQPLPKSASKDGNCSVNTTSIANKASIVDPCQQQECRSKDEESRNGVTQSSGLPTGQNEKPSLENTSTYEPPKAATSEVNCEPSGVPTVVQQTSNCPVNLESNARGDPQALSRHPSDTSRDLEMSLQPSASEQQPIQNSAQDKSKPDMSKDSKYKDMGTMTTETHSYHDAEVQAVAHVESKSVTTSPSILAAYLRENPFQLKDREEQVCIIYRGSGRPGHPQHGNAYRMPLHKDMALNQVITPKVRFRATAMEVLNPAYLKLHGRPGMSAEAACKISPNLTKVAYQGPEASNYPMGMYKGDSDAQAMRESHGLPQHPLSNPVLLNVKPAYQINIEASNQNKQCQRPLEIKTQQPQFMPGQEMNKRPGQHLVSVAENNQLRANRTTDHDQPATDGGGDRKPFHFKITNELGTTQAIITTDIIKPKKDDKPAFLNYDGEINSNIGATGGPVEEFLQVFIKKEQDKLQEENEQAKRSSSLSLQSRSASDFSHASSPHTPRLKKAREEKKEQKLAASATSDQPKLHLGKKLNQASSKSEEKGKESKSVKDVVWDEQGMTWEVYGASMDPESLGIAIQNHLTRQIREHEKMIRAQLKLNRKSISSDTSSSKKLKRRQNNVLQSLFQNFRRPNCCVHPPPSSVLD